MMKKTIVLLMTLLMCAALTACGGNNSVPIESADSGEVIETGEGADSSEATSAQTEEQKDTQQENQQQDTSEEKSEAKTEAQDSSAGPEAVSYSTNSADTVKNGNTGVYAYKNRGGMYDAYYVIDFDEGYVYYLSGESNDGDRVKIDSGDLNSGVSITYHDGEDVWSYSLRFKNKNQPDTLILHDNDGFEIEYYPADVKEALSIRDSKNLIDY